MNEEHWGVVLLQAASGMKEEHWGVVLLQAASTLPNEDLTARQKRAFWSSVLAWGRAGSRFQPPMLLNVCARLLEGDANPGDNSWLGKTLSEKVC